MPELPEVENFRQLLLPLVGENLQLQVMGDHHRVQVEELLNVGSSSIVCTDILRRGKQICLVLTIRKSTKYMFLHMGMSGRIRVYGKLENWGDMKDNGTIVGHSELPIVEDETSPPKYTYLIFSSTKSNYTAYFCDPRKFGSAYVSNDLADLDALAPDALTCNDSEIIQERILPALTNQRLGIKAILLDQKRAVSGVGNWVADEVLYQCKFHPDQTMLDSTESITLQKKLHEILSIAVKCLDNDESYPAHWLFHFRWTGKKAGKDAEGRNITFLTSGGRTTAIIASQQKLQARKSLMKSPTRTRKDIADQTLTIESNSNINKRKSKIITPDEKNDHPISPNNDSKAAHSTKRKRVGKKELLPDDLVVTKKERDENAKDGKSHVTTVGRRISPRLHGV